jgi:hypothetical protein
MAEGKWGWIDITSMRLADGTDLLPQLRYEHQDDDNFITAGTSLLANTWPFTKVFEGPEGVTVHEFGHQFWYGMVANNEFEEAWLDEGITSYSTGRVMETSFHTAALQLPLFRATELDVLRVQNGPDRRFDAILTPSWGFVTDYGFHVYSKAELVLRTFESTLGRRTLARVMRTFQERWRFRHPSSQDFFDTASEVSGRDLSSFFDQTIRGAGVVVQQATSILGTALRGAQIGSEAALARSLGSLLPPVAALPAEPPSMPPDENGVGSN